MPLAYWFIIKPKDEKSNNSVLSLSLNFRPDFPPSELLPSDRQLVHHGLIVHRCVTNQRLLEIPSSCSRVTGNNPVKK